MSSKLVNAAAKGVPFFTPAQSPPAGTPLSPSSAPTLFKPLTTRGVVAHNRFVVSPMCTYSASDGHLSDWHIAHLGQFALGGAGTVMVEATAVEPRGRISPEDSGLWQDSQIAPLTRIVDVVHSQGSLAGIQIGHAGRKASTIAPWLGGTTAKPLADESIGGWPTDVVGPSPLPYADDHAPPKELSVEEIKSLVQKFADSATRAVKAGFDVIELHGAHGYLHNNFLSPISNIRTDQYGGSFENRTRFLVETIQAVRAVIPESMPLWLRISATEWMDHSDQPSWNLEESIRLAKLLPGLGIDVLDVSSAGNTPLSRIPSHNRYQTDLAGSIRAAVRAEGLQLQIAAVGKITEAEMARSLVEEGKTVECNGDGTVEVDGDHGVAQAELILAARQFLRDPQWVLNVANELGVRVKWPNQYERAARRPRQDPGKL
ncbi:protein disulfide-isomerase precursor [Fusarium falciforme]|uniref:Protein disulfide-isomerase n=1 Tax=Fusarium falciforme TaxID=195108 RepID=A0A9W8QUV8_9HYPO|nr:protein disulfide-isomerase precursor [Fusarium falciforme]KAJ4177076.1 protein disulfide-isomerase precursor [Fusarium falciforme]KAJ4245699.1 protein disulfide-isomerase precursor [Fusarium falciforme]